MGRYRDEYDPNDDILGGSDSNDPVAPPGSGAGVADDEFSAQIRKWYPELLGREAGEPDISSHRGNPGGAQGAYEAIYGSEEAKAYRAKRDQPAVAPVAAPPPAPKVDTSGQPVPRAAGAPVPVATPGAGISSNSSPYSGKLDELLTHLMSESKRRGDINASREADNAAYRSKIRGSILDTIGSASKIPTMEDPSIQAQSRAFDVAGQGALKRGRSVMAARAAAEGTPTGAFDSALQGSEEGFAKARGANDAGLLADLTRQQRAQLMSAMQLGAGVLGDQENIDANSALAGLDAQLKGIGMGKDDEHFGLDLALRKLLGEGQLGVAGAGVNATNRATDNQHQQFYDRLAFDMGKEGNSMDDILLRLLLGGGA